MRRRIPAIATVLFAACLLGKYVSNRFPVPTSVNGWESPKVGSAETETISVSAVPVSMEVLFPAVDAPEPAVSAVSPSPSPDPVTPVDPAIVDQEELRAIGDRAERERQRIEAWYSEQVEELKSQLKRKLERLDGIDKLAWAQFYQRANETWSITSGQESGSVYDGGYGVAHVYTSRSEATATFVRGDPAGEYAAIVRRIKDSKQVTQQDFLKAQERLAFMREQKLDAVQTEADRSKAVIAQRRARTEAEDARRLSGDLTPRVEAVVGGADNQLYALIDGTLVCEGNTAQGYRVRKIQVGTVEFEKDGEICVQKID